jgi:hypothetical protein
VSGVKVAHCKGEAADLSNSRPEKKTFVETRSMPVNVNGGDLSVSVQADKRLPYRRLKQTQDWGMN